MLESQTRYHDLPVVILGLYRAAVALVRSGAPLMK